MEAQGPQQQPPGWYPNPQGPGQRYWDGGRWTDNYAPGPQVPEKRGGGFWRTCLIVTLAIMLAGAVLIVGCFALLGEGLEEAEQEQNETAITQQEFRSITRGMRESEVRQQLGRPGDAQEFENEGLPGDVIRSSCIYYNEEDQALGEGRYYQFCFDNGRLTAKNAY